MFDAQAASVRSAPFPHVLADQWLDADLYERLRRSFPPCPPNSGPTGFTLFAGDPDYDRLIAEDEAWARFHGGFPSQAFIDYALAAFADTFEGRALADLSNARYVSYRESREDKERSGLARVEHRPDELWVRVDIMQGRTGYYRHPHLDHRRRALSMLVYFCDADEAGMTGGDLILHARGGGAVTIRPRHNRMVMFPCAAGSIHSVSKIRRQSAPRNFVQVILSSSVDLWDGVTPPPPLWQQAKGRLRNLAIRAGLR